MLTKFESKSNRVKGLSFHATRPWVLTSLHNGVIQLWDYRMGTMLDRFDEHDGPVRGICFHRQQPLFVSGGDDYKIKVWDYKLRRCLFTLLGHLDYIRTVQFHSEQAWIVSGSDDQTIRIWNWQSRSCIAVLTGHNHYVMCAAFHPKDDLVVSASLDQTVRVWDTTGLRKKSMRAGDDSPGADSGAVASRVNTDLFGGTDAVVKYVLEGHDRGVNWASFHPTLPLIISGADDRQVKLWRMNETKAWEVDTMRGHTNNVSCVIFHPRHELLVSNSEDRSIRVWDISKRMGVQTFRRENDRFWILAAHQTQNLLAAGHDSGMIVFKLERERPASATVGDKLFYCKDRYLRMHEFNKGRDVPVVSLRRSGHAQGCGLGSGPRTLTYNTLNAQEHNVLVHSDADGGTYELICFPSDTSATVEGQESRRGAGLASVFIARNRFAVLDKNRQILIKNFQNEVTKKIPPPHPSTDFMFYGGTAGRLLLRSEDKISLFENQSRRIIGELQTSSQRIKYAQWNDDCSLVALMGKHVIILANRSLQQQCTVTETVRVKSGAWDSHGVFVYSTLNHIKYCLPNGDSGIIRTLDVPVYVTKVKGKSLHCLDREAKTRTLSVDTTECAFKLALAKRQYGDVMRMIRTSRLCGQAIIAYLQQKGFPEVALHFVKDNKTRFKLAIACGNIEVAMHSAYELEDDECWHKLGVEALRQGNHQVVEMAYQRTKNFERLSFLYLLTGNTEKLKKMLKIAEMRKDVMGRFHNALMLGDAEERVRILEEVGQLSLAYMCAATHQLEEQAARLKELLEEQGTPLPDVSEGAALLMPPTPIMREDNWPLLSVSKGVFEGAIDEGGSTMAAEEQDDDDDGDMGGDAGAWGDDDLDIDGDGDGGDDELKDGEDGDGAGGAWGDDDDLDLGDDDLDLGDDDGDDGAAAGGGGGGGGGKFFSAPSAGTDPATHWVSNSSLAADHAAAGSFETAMKLLNRQIGVVNFAPLKQAFMDTYAGAFTSLPTMPSVSALRCAVQRNSADSNPGKQSLPLACTKLPHLVDRLKLAYKLFQGGKFDESKAAFQTILTSIPLLVVDSRQEVNEVKELLAICREYITAIRLKLATAGAEPKRAVELGAYFTHCNLQPAHLLLSLNMAMVSAFKLKNFITAASFAQRLLELPEVSTEKNKALKVKAKKVLTKSEQEGRNAETLEYDERNPFVIDAGTLKPIYRGSDLLRCPYCGSAYTPDQKGTLCATCGLSSVGTETLGLVCSQKK
jgi:coatomer subunit alpha